MTSGNLCWSIEKACTIYKHAAAINSARSKLLVDYRTSCIRQLIIGAQLYELIVFHRGIALSELTYRWFHAVPRPRVVSLYTSGKCEFGRFVEGEMRDYRGRANAARPPEQQ